MKIWLAVTLLALLVALASAAVGGAASASGWIVFSASPQQGTLPEQLFRVRADGSGLRQVTFGAHVATDPAFSPAGRRIVFARLSSGVFVMNVDGSGLRRLTSGHSDAFPVWSPDGTRIAFLRAKANGLHVYVMRADGRGQHLLAQAPAPAGRPSWLANASTLIFPANGRLYKVDANSGRVLGRLAVKLDVDSSVAVPTLAPNGQAIAFVGARRSPAGCEGIACEVFALYRANARGGSVKLVDDGGPAGWSSDSRTLAYAHGGGLELRPLAGGTPTMISTGGDAVVADAPPAWQRR